MLRCSDSATICWQMKDGVVGTCRSRAMRRGTAACCLGAQGSVPGPKLPCKTPGSAPGPPRAVQHGAARCTQCALARRQEALIILNNVSIWAINRGRCTQCAQNGVRQSATPVLPLASFRPCTRASWMSFSGVRNCAPASPFASCVLRRERQNRLQARNW